LEGSDKPVAPREKFQRALAIWVRYEPECWYKRTEKGSEMTNDEKGSEMTNDVLGGLNRYIRSYMVDR